MQLNVRDLGAVGDGKADDTLALQQALDRCTVMGGGEVLVPAGDYLTGALTLRSHTTLHLTEGARLLGVPDLARFPVTQVRWEGRWIKGYGALIAAEDAERIAIIGNGEIIASPEIKGRVDRASGMRHPALMEFVNCRGVRVEDIHTTGNDMWSTHPVYCEDVVFRNVTVHSGADGIDVDSCRRVLIEGCDFQTADDCISLKSGRGQEGNNLARPCEDVTIRKCSFRDSRWACIGIGSETSGGIRRVLVEDCQCLQAGTFAIYIKSRPGRGAFIEHIHMRGLEVRNAKTGFLRLNLVNSGLQDPAPVAGLTGIPDAADFSFRDIQVFDVPVLVDAASLNPEKPLNGFTLSEVRGTCAAGMTLANIRHARLSNIAVTGFTGPLLKTQNVTGSGLIGATPAEPQATTKLGQ
jgi:polygalacturonase